MKIPRKQSDILLSTFLKYEEFVEALTEEQKEDNYYIIKNTVMIFYNLTEEEFNKRTYTTILDLYQIIQNILDTPQRVILTFKMNDIVYGLNPDFNSITFGELMDCDTTDVLQQISVLYRPVINKKGEKYLIEEYKANIETYEMFKNNLTLDIYNGFVSFFLKISESLTNYIQKYLMDQDINQNQKKILEKSMDGSVGYTNYAKVI